MCKKRLLGWGRVAFPLGLKAVQHDLQQSGIRAVLYYCE